MYSALILTFVITLYKSIINCMRKRRIRNLSKFLLMFFALIFTVLNISAQDRIITGKITDQKDGSPIGGVSVSAKGNNIGTQY